MSKNSSANDIQLEMIDVSEEVVQAEDKKLSLMSLIWMLLYLVVIVSICLLLVNFGFQRSVVEGESMRPTLESGDNIIVTRFSYFFNAKPKRYDIVVFTYDRANSVHYIKRVIGLPGETVQIKDGCVYIDGEKLEDDVYGLAAMTNAGIAADPITLGDGEYFVLGDNRNESSDSRVADVGIVYKDQIEGKAWLRIWPFSSFGTLKSTADSSTEE
jgi:signal peptidase I